ncbi:hypothetical protein [Kocuria sp. LHG3120]|uniref:hypothetical protein n=1 Tax=Kocuria sp. LHG3120 TaxID=2804590 RepID=UPI003CF655D1
MRVPLNQLIPTALLPEPVQALFDVLEIADFTVDAGEGFTQASLKINAAEGEPRIEFGGPDGFAVIFRELTTLDLRLAGELEILLGLAEIVVELPSVLSPASLDNGGWVRVPDMRQTITARSEHGNVGICWHSTGGFGLVWPQDANGSVGIPSINLSETLIADTGIVISARGVDIVPDPNDFRIEMDEADFQLPSDFPAAPDLRFIDACIDRRGFTGKAEVTWNDLAFDQSTRALTGSVVGQLFGWQGGLDGVLLEFKETMPVVIDIWGKLLVPYFDQPVDVRANFAVDGGFALALGADAEITLTREELLELRLQSLSFAVDADNVATMQLSGGLTPLLMASEGLQWPDFEVKDLTVDSTGKFTIGEAWVELKDLATLDLWGFHFEMRRIGIGYQVPRDRLWLDLSGGLRLIEAVPLGVDVEGFRLSWPRSLLHGVQSPLPIEQIRRAAEQIEVDFDGVNLFFGVPETIEFEGLIRFIKSAQQVAFAGDIALRVPAVGLSAEAGLLIGMNLGQPPFPFLYVYFGVELPAGIPLGQSGLALKGALGLFGLNVAPDRTPGQNWYHDWYKRGPIVGAHPTNKWHDERDAMALGIGVTITTVDGFVKGTRGLIVVVLPGPVLILEGRALLLEGLAPGEPPLRALAVFDGREKTIQLNIDAQAELIEDTLDASGGVEAFFDLEDLSNWHLYFGEDSPRNRRVHANVLNLLRADSYLMIDSRGGAAFRARMGAAADLDPNIPDVGPVSVTAHLELDGDGLLTIGPEQLSGDVSLRASVRLSAFGFSMQLGASAQVLLEGPRPFKVQAEVDLEADLPVPLPDFEASIPFSWQTPTIEVPEIASPLSRVSLTSRFAHSSTALSVHEAPADHAAAARASSEVPLDAGVLLEFRPEVNQPAGAPFLRHPGGTKTFDAGLMRFTPTVEHIQLFEHRKGLPWTGTEQDWKLVASTTSAPSWSGVWLADADPRGDGTPSARRLLLGSGNPLSHLMSAPPRNHLFLWTQDAGSPTAGEAVLEDYPELMTCTGDNERAVCITFDRLEPKPVPPGKELWINELRITSPREMRPQRDTHKPMCLAVAGYLDLRFPEPVVQVILKLCGPAQWQAVDLAIRSRARRSGRSQSELSNGRAEAQRRGNAFDPRACMIEVPVTTTATPEQWVFESPTAFSCLSLIRLDDFGIAEVCFVTADERERAGNTRRQCVDNAPAFDEMQLFRSDKYYRLTVRTSIAGALRLENLPFPLNHPLAGIASAMYAEALGQLELFDATKTFDEVAFFQTGGPPFRLESYVHSTHPMAQAERVFREDDFAMRFRRDYVQSMFAAETYPLELMIRAADGRLLTAPDYTTDWASAQSATRSADEETWDAHRQQHAIPSPPVRPDGILTLRRRPGGPGLLPSARYELLLTGGAGGSTLNPGWDTAAGWRFADGVWTRGESLHEILLGGSTEWGDIECALDYLPELHGDVGLLLRVQQGESAGIRFAAMAIRVLWPTPASSVLRVERVTRAGPADSWTVQLLHSVDVLMPDVQPLHVRVQVLDQRLRVWLFERRLIDVTIMGHPVAGAIALTSTAAEAAFQHVVVRDAVLHRVRFATSRFNRFSDLIASYDETGASRAFYIAAVGTPSAPDGALTTQRVWARAVWDWHRAQINHRDGLLTGGRAALEASRLNLREARARHEAAFHDWSSTLALLALQAQTTQLEVHLVRASQGVVAAWLRIPENLDLQHPVLQDPQSVNSVTIGVVGRTELNLTLHGGATQAMRVLADPGSHQVILLPSAGNVWAPDTYELRLTYHRNLGDEIADDSHRFDRPVEAREAQQGPEDAVMTWTVK